MLDRRWCISMPATQRHVLVLEFNQHDEWKVNTHLTVVEPAILKAVEGVEQRHVEEANHLSNGIDGKKTNYHTLKDRKGNTQFTSPGMFGDVLELLVSQHSHRCLLFHFCTLWAVLAIHV